MNAVSEKMFYKTEWTIRKFHTDEENAAWLTGDAAVQPYEIAEIEGNLLLNEGIQELIMLAMGTTGSPTAFNNANARIGVGDSSAAENATHTDLQAATNKLYKAMEATYPQRSNQTVTFRSVFGSTDANWAWNEFSVDNGGTALKNLNRKVSSQGTKAAGQSWTVDVAITFS